MNAFFFIALLALPLVAILVGVGLARLAFQCRRPLLAFALSIVWAVLVVVVLPRIFSHVYPVPVRIER